MAMAKKFVLGELSDQHEFILKIKEAFQTATKQTVAYVGVDKLKKATGVATKAVHFNFEEGQAIALVFRTDGDVIQAKLNEKVVPLSKVMDYDKMTEFNAGLDDLALKLKSNQEKFSLKRAQARVVIPRKSIPSLTVKKRIDQARADLKQQGEIMDKQKSLIAMKTAELEVLTQAGAA